MNSNNRKGKVSSKLKITNKSATPDKKHFDKTTTNPASSSTASGINLTEKPARTNLAKTVQIDRKKSSSEPMLSFASFERLELELLGKRFRKLDSNKSGTLSLAEFMSIQPLQSNPIVSRIVKIFDSNHDGFVDFQEFVHNMALFSSTGDSISKLKFAFKIFDVDEDGFISNGELFQVLQLMVQNNLEATQLQQVVDKAIIYADKDGDGKISFSEFCAVIGEFGSGQKVVVMNT